MIVAQSIVTMTQKIEIDACWKTKGIYGDRSCSKLVIHTHCRNCDVYTEAASTLRDQFYLQDTDEQSSILSRNTQQSAPEQTQRHIIFRLENQWFAIPSRFLTEVTLPVVVRAVPNRHSNTLLGVCNVRGQLTPCISLHRLFVIAEQQSTTPTCRMLVLSHPSGALVVSVDQILEITLLSHSVWGNNIMNSGSVLGQVSSAVAQHKGLSLTLLDADALLSLMLKELQ